MRAVAWALSELGDKGVFPTSQIPVHVSIVAMYGRAHFELQFSTVGVKKQSDSGTVERANEFW